MIIEINEAIFSYVEFPQNHSIHGSIFNLLY